MWVIEVIGALDVVSLRKKLVEISRKHAKKDVRELAAEIAEEFNEGLIEEEPMPKKR